MTLDIVYGKSVSGPEDEFILRLDEAGDTFGRTKVPGAFIADIIPIFQYIPAWCPGGAAQRVAQEHRPVIAALRDEPFNTVKTDMVRAPAVSWASF